MARYQWQFSLEYPFLRPSGNPNAAALLAARDASQRDARQGATYCKPISFCQIVRRSRILSIKTVLYENDLSPSRMRLGDNAALIDKKRR